MSRRLNGESLLFATHNLGKLEELQAMMAPYGVKVSSAKDARLPEPAETENSFIGNARIKAHAAARATGMVALADDSGLCVDALGGDPGVRTADWAETSSGRDFSQAMEKVHDALIRVGAEKPWVARFVSVLVLAWPDGYEQSYRGEVQGSLVWPIRGALGHGYDPMFVPDGQTLTFAEMTPAEKNAISHRARALEALVRDCFT
ncbi:MAG: RdgB/HAM1 family non-canonical purine NTP pyrophosphatase [Pararhodobacter sp.]